MVGYRSPDDGDAVRVVGVVPWVPRTAQGSVGLSLKCHVTAGVYKITVLAAFGGGGDFYLNRSSENTFFSLSQHRLDAR